MEFIKTVLIVFGVLFLVLIACGVGFMVKETMEERFDNKVQESLKRITGDRWHLLDNPIHRISKIESEVEDLESETEESIGALSEEVERLKTIVMKQFVRDLPPKVKEND